MKINNHFNLQPYNTFGIQVYANTFTAINTIEELAETVYELIPQYKQHLILGGGSNILFTKNFDGLVIKNNLKGITIEREDEQHIYVKANAGENWHELVMFCIENNFAGVENLSLIPGCVGAAPMQNIGAYGVELKDVFYCLEAYDIYNKTLVTFNKADCKFGYRESVFKHTHKNKFIITGITLQLNKIPQFKTAYGAIEQELAKMNITELSIKAIANAVMNIRQSKLPNPVQIGNAGSFFKNPIVENAVYHQIKANYPTVPGYKEGENHTKIPAAWLIEQCGFKGYRVNDAGCHHLQPLVLVNYGKATGEEIFALSEKIIDTVYKKFTIFLEREVNIY